MAQGKAVQSDDIEINELEAEICYAILRLQNEVRATQREIASFAEVSIATVSRTLSKRLIPAGIVKKVNAHGKNARFKYEIDTTTQIDNQDSARIALALYRHPKEDRGQNTVNTEVFLDTIVESGILRMLSSKKVVREKIEADLGDSGRYIEFLDRSIKLLPKLAYHINYIHLVAFQPEQRELKSYKFPVETARNEILLLKARSKQGAKKAGD